MAQSGCGTHAVGPARNGCWVTGSGCHAMQDMCVHAMLRCSAPSCSWHAARHRMLRPACGSRQHDLSCARLLLCPAVGEKVAIKKITNVFDHVSGASC